MKIKCKNVINIYICLSVFFLMAPFKLQGQIIPEERIFSDAWQNAGRSEKCRLEREIRNVKEFGAKGDGITDDQPAVVRAIISLDKKPGIIYLPAGKYLIQSPINVPSGVVIRGESAETATMVFDFVSHAIRIYGRPAGNWVPLQESADIFTKTVSVTDTTLFAPGQFAIIQQDDDPAWNITDAWAENSAGQIVKITGVEKDTLYLERSLRHDYPMERNPVIRVIEANEKSGVENIRLKRIIAGDFRTRCNKHTVHFSYAADGHVKGVHSLKCFGTHVAVYNSTKIEVTGSFFEDAHQHGGGGSGYGVRVQSRSGECLVQDNIFRLLRHSILLQAGANGNVFGYNYSLDTKSSSHPTWAGDISLHGNYPYANLFEGNIVEHIWIDNSHNGINGPYNTFFRNRAEKCGFNMTDPKADGQNIVGNELSSGDFLARIAAGNGYRLQGKDHFTYGNQTEAQGLQPPGTFELADYSYYLADCPEKKPAKPSWWTVDFKKPVIGPPQDREDEKNIPARARYIAGEKLTVPAR